MPKIFCCLCKRRTDTSNQRVRVGTDSTWPMLCVHSQNHDLDVNSFSRDDYVCMKCHSTISHSRMKDRGPNRITKSVKPITHAPGINKTVLRNFGKSLKNEHTAPNSKVLVEGNCFTSDFKTKIFETKWRNELGGESPSLLNGEEQSVVLDGLVRSLNQNIDVPDMPAPDDIETVEDACQEPINMISSDACGRYINMTNRHRLTVVFWKKSFFWISFVAVLSDRIVFVGFFFC